MFAEILHAVHDMNQGGVLHRDLKPQNILLVGDCTAEEPSKQGGTGADTDAQRISKPCEEPSFGSVTKLSLSILLKHGRKSLPESSAETLAIFMRETCPIEIVLQRRHITFETSTF